jgi:hypothetical protein
MACDAAVFQRDLEVLVFEDLVIWFFLCFNSFSIGICTNQDP